MEASESAIKTPGEPSADSNFPKTLPAQKSTKPKTSPIITKKNHLRGTKSASIIQELKLNANITNVENNPLTTDSDNIMLPVTG